MHGPELIWRFGRWIAARESGSVRLIWSEGEILLRCRRGNVVSAVGPEPGATARLLGRTPTGQDDLMVEARELASRGGVPETQAVAAAKEVLQQALASWLLDERRDLEMEDDEPAAAETSTISLTHAIVELVLSDTERDYHSQILPDQDVILRRASDFLQLYSRLRLSEEADLVVAKITGQRTAAEIAGRSPHGADEVVRLLAALAATGMLVPIAAPAIGDEAAPLTVDLPGDEEPIRRQLPVRWIAAAAVAAAIVMVAIVIAVLRPDPPAAEPGAAAQWGLVVDMGCEPQELQRVLTKARQYPNALRPVRAEPGSDNPCWRLVWGRFPSREAAQEEADSIPPKLLREGFDPHPVELPEADSDAVLE